MHYLNVSNFNRFIYFWKFLELYKQRFGNAIQRKNNKTNQTKPNQIKINRKMLIMYLYIYLLLNMLSSKKNISNLFEMSSISFIFSPNIFRLLFCLFFFCSSDFASKYSTNIGPKNRENSQIRLRVNSSNSKISI